MKRLSIILLLTIGLLFPLHSSIAQHGGPWGMISSMKTLVNNTATGVVTITLPAGGMWSGQMFYNITATDGTDFQTHVGYVAFSAVHKGVTYTTSAVHVAAAESTSVSAGTLTDAWTITTGSDLITLNLTANSSLGVAPIVTWTLFSETKDQTITPS